MEQEKSVEKCIPDADNSNNIAVKNTTANIDQDNISISELCGESSDGVKMNVLEAIIHQPINDNSDGTIQDNTDTSQKPHEKPFVGNEIGVNEDGNEYNNEMNGIKDNDNKDSDDLIEEESKCTCDADMKLDVILEVGEGKMENEPPQVEQVKNANDSGLKEQTDECNQKCNQERKEYFDLQLRSELEEFSNITSIHGPKRIIKAKGKTARIAWTLIFIGIVSLSVYLITDVVVKYYSYPIKDGISVTTQPLTFPSVTLCPFLPYRVEQIITDAYPIVGFMNMTNQKFILFQLYSYMQREYQLKEDMRVIRIWMQSAMDTSKGDTLNDNDKAVIQSWLELSSWLHKKLVPTYRWQVENIPLNDITIPGMQPIKTEDFILECTFNERPCDEQINITRVLTAYGYCFTLNVMNSTDLIYKIGPDEDITLILYTGQYNPLYLIDREETTSGFASIYSQPSDGIQVVVHNPETMPQPFREGFYVTPGRFASVKITQSERTRLLPPYGECSNEMYLVNSEFRYTYDTCVELCVQERIIAECGCVSPMYIIPTNHNFSVAPYCGNISRIFQIDSTWNVSIWKFLPTLSDNAVFFIKNVNGVINNLKCENNVSTIIKESCKCKRPCKEISYNHLINTIPWPEKSVLNTQGQRGFNKFQQNHKNVNKLLDKLITSYMDSYSKKDRFNVTQLYLSYQKNYFHDKYHNTDLFFIRLVEKNFMKINIHFESLDVRTVYEERTYTYDNVMKDIGNVFGFYLGMSAVSVVEAVYIIGIMVKQIIFRIACRLN